jgi:hypothetical protein
MADVLKFEILNYLYKILSSYEVMKRKVLFIKISYLPTNCNFYGHATYMRNWMLIETRLVFTNLCAFT